MLPTVGKYFLTPDYIVKWIEVHQAEVMFNHNINGYYFIAYASVKRTGTYAVHIGALGSVLNMMYTSITGDTITVQELLEIAEEDFAAYILEERKSDGTTLH